MSLWQLVCPLDQDGLLTPYFERGTRACTGISPERRRRHIAVDPRLKLPHGNAVVGYVRAWMDRTAPQAGCLHDRGNRQRIHVTRERVRVEQCNTRLLGRVHIMLRICAAHCGRGGKQARVPQELPSGDLHPYSKADNSRCFLGATKLSSWDFTELPLCDSRRECNIIVNTYSSLNDHHKLG